MSEVLHSQHRGPMSLTAIILTFNEHLHIRRCLERLDGLAQQIVVVDSGSTDDTVEVAESLGAVVLHHPFINHAMQLNWALTHAPIETDWVMRLDADEYLDAELSTALLAALPAASAVVTSFEVCLLPIFWGQCIMHGGMQPWLLRIWRKDFARCEERWMDEHMELLSGVAQRLPGHLVDHNLNTLSWWVDKHNRYASREVVDLLVMRKENKSMPAGLRGQTRLRRWLKVRLYARLPLGVRPFLYWLYRMVFRAGFLDGPRGMMFHTLQGLWYRLLVDGKVMEIEHTIRHQGIDLPTAVRLRFGIELTSSQD